MLRNVFYILDEGITHPEKSRGARHNSSANILEIGLRYVDLGERTLKILVHSLRNEENTENVQLTHALCAQFCLNVANYELHHDRTPVFDINVKTAPSDPNQKCSEYFLNCN